MALMYMVTKLASGSSQWSRCREECRGEIRLHDRCLAQHKKEDEKQQRRNRNNRDSSELCSRTAKRFKRCQMKAMCPVELSSVVRCRLSNQTRSFSSSSSPTNGECRVESNLLKRCMALPNRQWDIFMKAKLDEERRRMR
eukprot:gnl/Spiro4/10862_TR5786_c0_g1_i1.p2 gnl/Spiro4/10862_TR5786_c0_g1~~gnl/Spiro4/10862_TR5786_c0_g1_i1.p2  ORF type:complete len:140 (-),score=16.91 gnl/Spiro4/10862_TR5786_c0_g1_i1:74-493(-)